MVSYVGNSNTVRNPFEFGYCPITAYRCYAIGSICERGSYCAIIAHKEQSYVVRCGDTIPGYTITTITDTYVIAHDREHVAYKIFLEDKPFNLK